MTELPRIMPTTPSPAIRPLKRGRPTSRDPRKQRDDDASSKHDDKEEEEEDRKSPARSAPDGTDSKAESEAGSEPESEPAPDAPRHINIRV